MIVFGIRDSGKHGMNDNRMRPIRETITLEAARELIDGVMRPIDRTERVRLDAAGGRVVASPVSAQADVPPFARAAMDGYAVRAADTIGASTHDPRVLTWVETVFTGQGAGGDATAVAVVSDLLAIASAKRGLAPFPRAVAVPVAPRRRGLALLPRAAAGI